MREHLMAAVAGALFCAVLGSGCAHDAFIWVDELSREPETPELDRLRAGDKIFVRVWKQPDITVETDVRRDGYVTLPLIGDVAVIGLSLPDAANQIGNRLTGLILDPRVSVSLTQGRPDFVTLLGEVNSVGSYPLAREENLLHMVAKAGGLSAFADETRIFVIRRRATAQRVRFSYARMKRGEGRGLEFKLRDGDVIIVE